MPDVNPERHRTFVSFWLRVFRVLGFRVWGLEFRVLGSGFGVQGLELRVWGLGFRVGGFRSRVYVLGDT